MPSAFAVIEAGMDVSEVAITSLSTVIDSRMRLASSEFGPSWARVKKRVSDSARASAQLEKRPGHAHIIARIRSERPRGQLGQSPVR